MSSNWDEEVLARTLYGEARGERREGIEAVAAVMMNRLKAGRWGKRAASVCLARKQFSCWDDGNRERMAAVDSTDAAFVVCQEVALLALTGQLVDPTQGSLHYHVASLTPYWAHGKTPVCIVGAHAFYNNVA